MDSRPAWTDGDSTAAEAASGRPRPAPPGWWPVSGGLATSPPPRHHLLRALAWLAFAQIVANAFDSGAGVRSPACGFFGLLSCALALLLSRGDAIAMALACAASVGGLALAELAGRLPGGVVAASATPLAGAAAVQWLLVGCGLAIGLSAPRSSGGSMAGRARPARRQPPPTADGALQDSATQQALAASEARYRALFERAPSPLVLHRDLRVIAANPACAALFGFANSAAMRGFQLAGLLRDDAQQQRLAQRAGAMDRLPIGGSLPVCDYQLRSIDGRPVTTQVSSVRVDTVDGPAALSIFVDITERAAAEAALRESRNTLATLFDNSADGMALTHLDSSRYVMVNERCARLLGWRADELIGRTAIELGVWHHPAERARLTDGLAANGRVSEMPAVFNTKSGGTVLLNVSAALIELDGQRHLIANLRDLSETGQLRLEHAAVFRGAIVGIALLHDGRFVLANPRFEALFGWLPGTLNGQRSEVVWPDPAAYGEDRARLRPLLTTGQSIAIERPMRRADGSTFWCRLQAQAVDPGNPVDSATVWIGEDITERRLVDAQLATARDQALAASRAKSAFLANTSHEIRTPLNGLIGLAQLAAQRDLTPALRAQYLQHIVDSAQSLAAIISDILDLSKIEAGKLVIEAAVFALRDTLSALQRKYLPLAEARGLRLHLLLDDGVPAAVRGDAGRLRQILENYLTNALKFTEQGDIRIAVRRADAADPDRLRFSVADSGPGIDDELRQRLFTPFTQGDDSTTRRFGGSGLGLSICRELATLMGGAVGVDSRPGCGSEFWLELPLPVAAAPADAARDAAASGDAGEATATACFVTAAVASPPPRPLDGMRVLVVEDNPVNMLIASAMLARWGAEASEAVDGFQAVDAVMAAARDERPFDVVLMDVQMPQISGHETTRRLRQHFDAEALPIIALTAAALVAERDLAHAAGMNDFLTKPIDATRLFETLRRYRNLSAAAD